MVFLLSDIMVFILVLSVIAWFFYAIRKEHWRNAMAHVGRNKLAVFCFGILLVYVGIGLLDSVHFKVTQKDGTLGETHSLLDAVSSPLLFDEKEKTYSSPLATRSFMKEIIAEGGKREHKYPKLYHAGQHLEGRSHMLDILIRCSIIIALAVAFFLLLNWFNRFRYKQGGETVKPLSIYQNVFWVGLFTIFMAILILGSSYHILGTDKTGNDVFYQAVKSIRVGLIVGTLTTLIVTPLAIMFGTLAGYLGGWVDDLVQYVYTTLSSIPSILLIAAAMLIINASLHNSKEETLVIADKKLFYLCVILGITSWTGLCRLVRGEVLKLKNIEYVRAADALGVSRVSVMIRHLVPNVMHIVLISVILRFSGLVLFEAVLAYVGIGVDPSLQSWGNMINNARLELAREPVVWWNLIASFVFMFGLVLPANIFGDAVRDALDPRLRGEQ